MIKYIQKAQMGLSLLPADHSANPMSQVVGRFSSNRSTLADTRAKNKKLEKEAHTIKLSSPTKYFVVGLGIANIPGSEKLNNLSAISKALGVPMLLLIEENNITNPDIIKIGQKLKYTSKSNTKDWNAVKKEQLDFNNKHGKNYENLISEFNRGKRGFYIIDDKPNNKFKVYKDGKLIKEFNALHGANGQLNYWSDRLKTLFSGANPVLADNFTITRLKNGKIDDGGGNLSTPAGVYYMSPTGSYKGFPAWTRHSIKGNPVNNKGIPYSEVPSSVHLRNVTGRIDSNGRFIGDKFTNGCTGLSGKDLVSLKNILGNTKDVPIYILPNNPDTSNFYVRNNTINYRSSLPELNWMKGQLILYQRDSRGNIKKDAKGRPIPITTAPQLNGVTRGYIGSPVFTFDKIDRVGDRYSDHLIQVATNFANSLSLNKEQLMLDLEDAGLFINDDTYNDLAMASLGILGRESSYGKLNSEINNALKYVGKALSKAGIMGSASPDIYRKYTGYNGVLGANSDSNSIGLTQMRLSGLSPEEKDLLQKYNITKRDLVYDPQKAAIATMIHLAKLYRDQGTNLDKAIGQWNTRSGYADSVHNLSNEDFLTTVDYYN